jgi:hypothetical protein
VPPKPQRELAESEAPRVCALKSALEGIERSEPVDVALRPFIVAVANAIIKDILRERRNGASGRRLRKA